MRYVYMCKIDYECELEDSSKGTLVYASLADLKEHRKCVAECGIVKVKVELEKVLQESNRKSQKKMRR